MMCFYLRLPEPDILDEAVKQAKLIIIDEAHRVSPNGTGYKRILECFSEKGRDDAHLLGLTASPERRTADQRDQLSLAFDAIIDGADMDKLFDEGILVRPRYRPHFIHDLELNTIDISSGDFPVAKLAPAIIKSSMISHACSIYLEEREQVKPAPISAWFCPDVTVAETTVEAIEELEFLSALLLLQHLSKSVCRCCLAMQKARLRRWYLLVYWPKAGIIRIVILLCICDRPSPKCYGVSL